MATLTVQVPPEAGEAISLTAADGDGDEYPNSGREMLVVDNAGGSAITVTFTAVGECDYGTAHDSGPHTVGAGAQKVFPGVSVRRFNNDNGRVGVSYSDVTSVTVGVIKAT